jgi:hypothetical protein
MPRKRWPVVVQQGEDALLAYHQPVVRNTGKYSKRGFFFWIPWWVEALLQQYHGPFKTLRVSITEDGRLVLTPIKERPEWPERFMRVFEEGERLVIVVGEKE